MNCRYGFVGLGELGACLAGSLRRAGFPVLVHDLDRERATVLEQNGAQWSGSIEALAEQADSVITCLPSPEASERVLKILCQILNPGATWIEMSTLGREDIIRLADFATQAGIDTLELPVTGGVHLAARGEITMLVGGDAEVFERHRLAIEAMGRSVYYLGSIGKASLLKVITNMLAFVHLKADAQALMLARRGGLDLAQAWAAIRASSGNSFVHETEGQLILNGSYDIGFNLDLALKDLGFALDFGREFGVPLDLAALTEQTYIEAKAAFGGSAQSPMIAKLLEDRLATDLRADGFPRRLDECS